MDLWVLETLGINDHYIGKAQVVWHIAEILLQRRQALKVIEMYFNFWQEKGRPAILKLLQP